MSNLTFANGQRALAAACGVALLGATACGVRLSAETETSDESGAASIVVAPEPRASAASPISVVSVPTERSVYLVATQDDAEALREVLAGLWPVTGGGEVVVVRSAEEVAQVIAEVAADDAVRWTRGLPPARVYDIRPGA